MSGVGGEATGLHQYPRCRGYCMPTLPELRA